MDEYGKTLFLNDKHNLTQSQILTLRIFIIVMNDLRLKSKPLLQLQGELLVETTALYGRDKK